MTEKKYNYIDYLVEWMKEDEDERYEPVRDFIFWMQNKIRQDEWKDFEKLLGQSFEEK